MGTIFFIVKEIFFIYFQAFVQGIQLITCASNLFHSLYLGPICNSFKGLRPNTALQQFRTKHGSLHGVKWCKNSNRDLDPKHLNDMQSTKCHKDFILMYTLPLLYVCCTDSLLNNKLLLHYLYNGACLKLATLANISEENPGANKIVK